MPPLISPCIFLDPGASPAYFGLRYEYSCIFWPQILVYFLASDTRVFSVLFDSSCLLVILLLWIVYIIFLCLFTISFHLFRTFHVKGTARWIWMKVSSFDRSSLKSADRRFLEKSARLFKASAPPRGKGTMKKFGNCSLWGSELFISFIFSNRNTVAALLEIVQEVSHRQCLSRLFQL
jgi:hypothetical protein